MDASSHKSSIQIALFLFFLLIVWKIFEIILNYGLGAGAGSDENAFGHLSLYVVQPLILMVVPFLAGWLITNYTRMVGYVKFGLYAFIGVVVVQLFEYVITVRIFDAPFPFLSRFIGILFVASIFTVFFLFGVRWGVRYSGKLNQSNS